MQPDLERIALRNVRSFTLFRVAFTARFYYPVYALLFLDYGLTLAQFGILNAVWAATIVLAEVPSGALADTIGRRALLVVTGVLMVLEMAVLLAAPIGGGSLLFGLFLANRVISGLAEAAASGADEALTYDSLKAAGLEHRWGHVLERVQRDTSLAFFFAMMTGAAVYDPAMVNAVLQFARSWCPGGAGAVGKDADFADLFLRSRRARDGPANAGDSDAPKRANCSRRCGKVAARRWPPGAGSGVRRCRSVSFWPPW